MGTEPSDFLEFVFSPYLHLKPPTHFKSFHGYTVVFYRNVHSSFLGTKVPLLPLQNGFEVHMGERAKERKAEKVSMCGI